MISGEVKDFCGCSFIEFNHKKPVLKIGGRNADGKSSLALAIGMIISGNGNPMSLTKALMPNYSHNGSAASYIRLDIDGGGYISGEWRGDGALRRDTGEKYQETPDLALETICGLREVASLDKKAWRDMFSDITVPFRAFCIALMRDFDRPLPTEKDFENYAKCENAAQKFIAWAAKLHEKIAERGAQDVVAELKESRTKAKRDWENAASGDGVREVWGDSKSPKWAPQEWLPEYETLSEGDIIRMISEAEERIQSIAIEGAITSVQQTELEEKAARAIQLQGEYDNYMRGYSAKHGELQSVAEKLVFKAKKIADDMGVITRRIITAKASKDALEKEREGLERDTACMACPKCGEKLRLDGQKLVSMSEGGEWAKKMSRIRAIKTQVEKFDDDIKRLENTPPTKAEYDRVDAEQKKVAGEMSDLTTKMRQDCWKLEQGLKECNEAKAKLDKLYKEGNKSVLGKRDENELSKAEKQLDEQRKILGLKRRYDKANSAARRVFQLSGVIKSIESGGVSKEVRKHGVEAVRGQARNIGGLLGLECDLVDDIPTLAGRPIMFCSESEQWLLSFVVKRALCVFFRVPVIIADRFDVLDETRRGDFLGVVEKLVGNNFKVLIILAGTTTPETDKREKTDIILSCGTQNGEGKNRMAALAPSG